MKYLSDIHFPELYEAHRIRSPEFVAQMLKELNMPRGRPKGSSNKKSTQAEALQTALDFVSYAENDILECSKFVKLNNNMAVVFSSQISAGHPIDEELNLIPNLAMLRAGIARCGKSLVITETNTNGLSIKGDKLRAVVPCSIEVMPEVQPDPPVIEGDFNILKEAFKVCGTLASEAGEKVYLASLLLNPNTCTGTNGSAIMQYWHGINMPAGTVISKLFAAAVVKQSKDITGIGANYNSELGFCTSFTVWFKGGAWLKTQCYQDRWPDIATVLDKQIELVKTPEGLFEGIDATLAFADSKAVYFAEGYINSHDNPALGAQYQVEGLTSGKTFDGKLLKQVAPWADKVDLTTYPDRLFFAGGEASNPVRGCVAGYA